jgi:hypothetical protein
MPSRNILQYPVISIHKEILPQYLRQPSGVFKSDMGEIGDPVQPSLRQEFKAEAEHKKEFRKILGELGFKIGTST